MDENVRAQVGCYAIPNPRNQWQAKMLLEKPGGNKCIYKPVIFWKSWGILQEGESLDNNISVPAIARYWWEKIDPFDVRSPQVMMMFLHFENPKEVSVYFSRGEIEEITLGFRVQTANKFSAAVPNPITK